MSLGVRMNQTVAVARLVATPNANKQIVMPTLSTIYATMKCSIEPLKTFEKQTIMGRLPNARYRLTCSGEKTIKDGDQVTWDSIVYTLNEPIFDNVRRIGAYISAILSEGP